MDLKNINDAIPYRVVAEHLLDRHRSDECSRTTVSAFNGTFQFDDAYICHVRPDNTMIMLNLAAWSFHTKRCVIHSKFKLGRYQQLFEFNSSSIVSSF